LQHAPCSRRPAQVFEHIRDELLADDAAIAVINVVG
jgi:hypothetical protein